MNKKKNSNSRPKMQILENAYNEIINTIGSRPAESGGLLFGKEDDMIVRKFVFDKHALTTRSTYTFNTEFLNPEIKRIWNEEGLSCIGFIHSHPHGYGHPSPPDIEYFTSMFDNMPRKHYITPIVFSVPDGGFKMNAFVLFNQTREPIRANVEVLPEDYFQTEKDKVSKEQFCGDKDIPQKQNKFDYAIQKVWSIWKLTIALILSWFFIKTLIILTNKLQEV